ncbi:MAG: Hsp20/alpha crystallin family protein [Anaerolineae bacterium]|nr:Hsp20/alpha crystallin family protein [Anaerolineae bacterium]
METNQQEVLSELDPQYVEMLNFWRDPASVRRWHAREPHKMWRPPTDVYETDDAIVVKVEIAGMKEEELEVSLDGRRLSIRGVRRDSGAKLRYQQMEIQYGPFETEVEVPRALDYEQIEASYENGFLMVRLGRAQPHRIAVQETGNPD